MKKLIFSLALCFFASQIMAQEFKNSFDGIKDIKLTTGSGNVDLIKGSGNSVEVRLVHEMGSDYAPVVRKEGDNLIITDGKKKIRGKFEWFITMPDDMDMNLTTGSGNIDIEGLNIDLKAISGSGNLDIKDASGYVTINIGSGNIDIVNYSGDFKGNAGSGNADIEGLEGSVALNCGSGNVDIIDANAQVSVNVGSGSIDAKNITVAGKSGLNSGSGNVLLRLAATPTHDLSLNSGSGSATLDRNNHELNADIVMTTSKKSGDIVAPFDFDKTEEVNEGGSTMIRKSVSVGSGSKVKISIGTGSGTARIR